MMTNTNIQLVNPKGTRILTRKLGGFIAAITLCFPVFANQVGISNGQFRVNESGNATYNLPIQVAQGRAGVAPKLSLGYSSGNTYEGSVGVGWSVSGLSSISRCPQQPIYDNGNINAVTFTSEDRFCLDGQRLLLKSGTYGAPGSTYYTEIDNFARISAHGGSTANGPTYFEVQNKAGETHYYGNPAAVTSHYSGVDAFVEPGGHAAGVLARSWAIKIVEDAKGNYIKYNYAKDTAAGTFYIDDITYAGWFNGSSHESPFAKVDFVYSDYDKGFMGFMAGSYVYNNKLLSRIDTLTDNQVYRSYHLDYETSSFMEERTLLTAVQECSNTARTSCFPATTFDWQRPALATSTTVEVCADEPGFEDICWDQPTTTNFSVFPSVSQIATVVSNTDKAQVLDINGDGYSDIVYMADKWRIKFGPSFATTQTIQSSKGKNKLEHVLNIDYDGDGIRDLLMADSASDNWWVLTYDKNAPAGTLCDGSSACSSHSSTGSFYMRSLGFQATGLEEEAQIMDVNGDGLEDIVYRSGSDLKVALNQASGVFVHSVLYQAVNTIDSFLLNESFTSQSASMKSASAIDINGDGRSDLINKLTETTGGCYVGGQLFPGVFSRGECERDILGTWISNTSTQYRLFVSSGPASAPVLEQRQVIGNASYIDALRAADFNGDGLTDIAYENNGKWYYRLSNGVQFLPPKEMGLSTNDSRKYLTYFIDINNDGRADVLNASSTSNWAIYFSKPTPASEYIAFVYRGNRSFEQDSTFRFGDSNGDGKLDMLSGKNGTWKEYTSREGIKEFVINRITNGFGVETDIQYKPMTNSSVYPMKASDFDTSIDTFSPVSGMQVVSRVTSQINTGSSVGVSYQYGGLLVHKKGRGSLGYQMLRTTDEQTGVITETQYNQSTTGTSDFAKAKMPVYTQQSRSGRLLMTASNTLAVRSTSQGGWLPYISSSNENKYIYNSNGTNTWVSNSQTSNQYDAWGNLTDSSITVTDKRNNHSLVTSTVHDFGTANQQMYGRLQSTTVTKNRTGQPSISRKTNFTYNSDNLLHTSVVSPDEAYTRDPDLNPVAGARLTTTYSYDKYGNKTSIAVNGNSTVTGSAQTRTTTTNYESRGRFVNYTQNALGERLTFKYNGVAAASHAGGILSSVTEVSPNGLSSTSNLNAFGQVTSTVNSTGNTTTINRYFGGSSVASGAHYYESHNIAGAPNQEIYYDRWGREVGKRVQGFNGNWILTRSSYDSRGRQYRSYEPGSSTEYTQFAYDDLDRVNLITRPNGATVSQSVNGLTVSNTNELGQTSKTTDNAFGETESTEDAIGNTVTFGYDSFGNLLTATTVADGQSSVVLSYYDKWGRKYKTDDPVKGVWYYSYNAFGELYTQTTARGHQFTFSYDALGRKIRSYEPNEGTLCWIYGTSAAAKSIGKLVTSKKYAGANVNCSSTASADITKTFTFDTKGRAKDVITDIKESGVVKTYSQSQTYDTYSRPLVTTYPTGTSAMSVKNLYNSTGYLSQLKNNVTGQALKTINSMDNRLQVTGVTYGNGVTETNTFYADTGWLHTRNVGTINQLTMQYDAMGNVTSRESDYNATGGSRSHFTESYQYDNLNRLEGRTFSLSANGNPLPQDFKSNHTYTYDGWGNFTYKSGAGYYRYDASKVHKLLGVYEDAAFAGDQYYQFSYDNNGNITADGQRSFVYGSFDKPTQMARTDGSASSTMHYGVNRELYLKTDCEYQNNKKTEITTTYVGDYEKVVRSGGEGALTEHKYNLGNIVITQRSSGTSDTFYLHQDHQGSVIATTDATGAIVSESIFDPWGKRTQIYQDSLLAGFAILAPTDKGYTGHKHIDGMGIIHMGGRIYDPTLGRFLQADPHIQSPLNSQSYNRYAYVLNNPMSYADPSGYFFKSLFKFVKKYWKQIVSIAATFVLGPVLGGMLSGYLTTGNLKGALLGAFTGALGASFGGLGGITGFVANGIVGGLASKAMGGKFGHGFWSAGLGSALGGRIQGLKTAAGRIIAKAVLGGTISKLTGGKFGNGAWTSAFAASLAEIGAPAPVQEADPNDAQYAELSNAVYDDNLAIDDQVGNYTVKDIQTDDSGLKVALFVDGSGNHVAAFAGTSPTSWANWKSNFLQALGFSSPQYTSGMKWANTYFKQANGNIHFTGHSLGGGLASAAAIRTGTSATVFNAAGVHNNSLGGVPRSAGDVTYYYSSHDALRLGNMLTPASVPGRHINLGNAGWHGMGGMCEAMGANC